MKKRSAKRIKKQQQITDEEKQLLDLMARLIVEIILRENVDQVFDIGEETERNHK